MIHPIPKIDAIEPNKLAHVGHKLKRIMKRDPVNVHYTEDPLLMQQSILKALTEHEVQLLASLNIIKQVSTSPASQGNFEWQFLPVLGHDLLLFRDLHRFVHEKEFVWLQPYSDRPSWTFIKKVPITEFSTVLDLGTGTGLLALLSANKGASSVNGIDINPRAINLARMNGVLNGLFDVQFDQANFLTYPKKYEFDIVVSQPPFDPVIDVDLTDSFAFNGRSKEGLHLVQSIVERYYPHRANQYLAIYFHSFDTSRYTVLRDKIKKWIKGLNIKLRIHRHPEKSIEEWWNQYKLRRNIDVSVKLPPYLQKYELVVGYTLILKGRKIG